MRGPWDSVLQGFEAQEPPEVNPKDHAEVVVEKPQERRQRQPRKAKKEQKKD